MVNWVCTDLLGLCIFAYREHCIPSYTNYSTFSIAMLSHYLRIAIFLFIYLRPLPDVLYLCFILDPTTYSTIDAHMLVLCTSNVGSYRRRPRIRASFTGGCADPYFVNPPPNSTSVL